VVRNNYKLRAFTIQQDFIKGMALGMSWNQSTQLSWETGVHLKRSTGDSLNQLTDAVPHRSSPVIHLCPVLPLSAPRLNSWLTKRDVNTRQQHGIDLVSSITWLPPKHTGFAMVHGSPLQNTSSSQMYPLWALLLRVEPANHSPHLRTMRRPGIKYFMSNSCISQQSFVHQQFRRKTVPGS
jgi:hypothetical protein